MQPLLRALSASLLPHLDLPFAFFGHSMGATIGYEWAQKLRREGHEGPRMLLVAARRAPHVPPLEAPIYALADPAFKQKLRELNGTPEEVLEDDELMALLMPLLRADFEINDTYRPSASPPLDCPISAFGGQDDDAVPLAHLEAWRELTCGSFRLKLLPGNHFTLIAERSHLVAGVATELMSLVRDL